MNTILLIILIIKERKIIAFLYNHICNNTIIPGKKIKTKQKENIKKKEERMT